MRVILFSFLLFGLAWADLNCECGKRNAGRIVGGKETKKNEYPWMVALQTTTSTFTYCGGTILTPWHVVTAAHCVRPVAELLVVVGAYDVNDFSDINAVVYGVSQAINHKSADLAVLVTSTEMQFNEVVGPACLPDRHTNYGTMTGKMVKAMGWGRYDPARPNMDKIKKLREVDLEIIAPTNCNSGTAETNVCAYSKGKDTCNGDSGGPLLWLDPETNRFTLVAIVSTGPEKCGSSNDPSVNVNIMHFKNWINDRISDTKEDTVACENDVIY